MESLFTHNTEFDSSGAKALRRLLNFLKYGNTSYGVLKGFKSGCMCTAANNPSAIWQFAGWALVSPNHRQRARGSLTAAAASRPAGWSVCQQNCNGDNKKWELSNFNIYL